MLQQLERLEDSKVIRGLMVCTVLHHVLSMIVDRYPGRSQKLSSVWENVKIHQKPPGLRAFVCEQVVCRENPI